MIINLKCSVDTTTGKITCEIPDLSEMNSAYLAGYITAKLYKNVARMLEAQEESKISYDDFLEMVVTSYTETLDKGPLNGGYN